MARKDRSDDFSPEDQEDPGEAMPEKEGVAHELEEKAEVSGQEADESEEDSLYEAAIQSIGSTLAKTRDEWIRHRIASGWDRRCYEDLEQYIGRDAHNQGDEHGNLIDQVKSAVSDKVGTPLSALQGPGQLGTTRSTVFVNITRPGAHALESRILDILVPTDGEHAWRIEPTEDPDAQNAREDGGQLINPATGQPVLVTADGTITDDPELGKPVTKTDIAMASERVARASAKAMSTKIADYLTECRYKAELRKIVHNASKMGTGVLKGPIVTSKMRSRWIESAAVDEATGATLVSYVREQQEDRRPASWSVDPRYVWEDPDCGEDLQAGAGIFELEYRTPKRVRELLKDKRYNRKQLLKVLGEGPKQSAFVNVSEADYHDLRNQGVQLHSTKFQHWHYWGELTAIQARVAGVEVPESIDDEESINVCVEMINDTVVRAYENPLECGSLPYDFYPLYRVSGTMRGLSQPRIQRAEQLVTNAAWRAMLDNARMTAGPIVLFNKKSVMAPGGGPIKLAPFTVLYSTDDAAKVQDMATVLQFQSHQAEFANVIRMAQDLGRESSAMNAIMSGSTSGAPETKGVAEMLQQSSNVVLRRLVTNFDDLITVPHLTRYYDYEMAYGTDDRVKGDYRVKAIGSTTLLQRDEADQTVMQMLAAGANPLYSPYIDPQKLITKVLKSRHVDVTDIFYDEEKIRKNLENQGKQPPPNVQAAMINAEARLKQAEAVAHGRATEVEVMRESEAEDRRLRILLLQMQIEAETIKLAAKQNVSVEQIKAQLATSAMQERTRKEIALSNSINAERKADRLPTGAQ